MNNQIPAHLLAECLRASADGYYELPPETMISISPEFLTNLLAMMALNNDLVSVAHLIDELESGREAQ